MSPEENYTRIFLHNVALDIRIGYFDWEKEPGKKWPVSIDVEMFTARTEWNGVSMEGIVDYDRVHQYLQTWEDRPHIEFLETLAEDLLQFCFQDEKVFSVRVGITKTQLYANGVVAGIEINRKRETCSG